MSGHTDMGTEFYLWNALLAQSTWNSRTAHAWSHILGGSTSAPASQAIWKRTFHALCMIRKLEWASGHSCLTFRSRQEGSCPWIHNFGGFCSGLPQTTSLLMEQGIHGVKGMQNPAVPSPPWPNVSISEGICRPCPQVCPLKSRLYRDNLQPESDQGPAAHEVWTEFNRGSLGVSIPLASKLLMIEDRAGVGRVEQMAAPSSPYATVFQRGTLEILISKTSRSLSWCISRGVPLIRLSTWFITFK